MSNYTGTHLTYYSETEIDGTVTGSTLVTTTAPPAQTYNLYPIKVFAKIDTTSGVITPAVVSVGTNSPDYNNIVQVKTIGNTAGDITLLDIIIDETVIPPSTPIYCKVNVACIGTSPVSQFKIGVTGAVINL